MLIQYFKRQSRIVELRNGPGGQLLEGFADWLFHQSRYHWVAARKHIRAAEHFFHWVDHRRLGIPALEDRLAEKYLDHLKRCRCSGHRPPLKPERQKYSIDLFFRYLRHTGIVLAPTEPVPHSPVLTTFCDWMRRQRGASDTTVSIYSFELRAFIKKLGEDPSRYSARNLRQFVLDKTQQSGWASARKCICAIRMFLRFLVSQGRCPATLYASIPTLAHWRLSALPRYLQPDQIEQIIASPDLTTSLGRRNRAILLLLARLGLRAGDVVRLRLGDLDWQEGVIRVSGKGRRETVLPLTQEVGDALAGHIKDDRPQVTTDAVFVRSFAPYRAFAESTAISRLVARAMRRVGICPKRGAAHILRHSVASSMLRHGVSLQEIAGVLRHRSLLTTEIYAKVDVLMLQEIAQPWPEVTAC